MATKTKRRPTSKPRTKASAAKAPSPNAQRSNEEATLLRLSTPVLLGLTLGVAALYFVYSLFSDGFYQHDEAAHYLNMRAFWHDPSAALGNWAKLGYKLIYALPALLGPTAVLLTNCLVAAFSCYVAYRVAEHLGAAMPLLAFVLLAFQPMWLQLSSRNYSELITALLLILAVYAHVRDRRLWAALALSYVAMIRQEFYPILLLYGLFLLYERKWLAAAALAVFPLVQNVWGWVFTGDPLYLVNQIVGQSAAIQDAWPRQGFDHYFTMSLTIFGALALVSFLAYLGQALFYRKKLHLVLLIPLAVFFLEHALFNWQAVQIGPSTGGNLRYLIVVAPLVAVLGGLALDRLAPQVKDRTRLAILLVPFLLVVVLFLGYEHNNIKLVPTEPSAIPLLTTLLATALVFLPLSKRWMLAYATVASLVIAALTVRPFSLTPEDRMMKTVAQWAEAQDIEDDPLFAMHALFYYYYGKAQPDFEPDAESITQTKLDAAPVGSTIIWDSHYSYRPRLREDQVQYTDLLQQPERFRLLHEPRQFITPDQRFAVFAFEKIAQ